LYINEESGTKSLILEDQNESGGAFDLQEESVKSSIGKSI